MAIASKTGLFNLALAGLAAAASSFAIYAMPRSVLASLFETIGLSSLMASLSGGIVRAGLMAGASVLVFGLSWLALRSCDPRERIAPLEDRDWRTLSRFSHVSSPSDADEPVLDEEIADPFTELARGAEPVDGLLELGAEQIDPAEPVSVDASEPYGSGAMELLARKPTAGSGTNGASGMVQRLNAGLAKSEWPLASGDEDEAAEDVEHRLRGVLTDLQSMARRA